MIFLLCELMELFGVGSGGRSLGADDGGKGVELLARGHL